MVIGELDVFAKLLPVAEIEAAAQSIHLVSGVVYVVLALYLTTAGLENICEHIAYGGPPAMPYVKRTGRISAHKLHLDLRASFDFKPSVVIGIVENLSNNPVPRRRLDEKINETRPGYFDFFEYGTGIIKVGYNLRGDLPEGCA